MRSDEGDVTAKIRIIWQVPSPEEALAVTSVVHYRVGPADGSYRGFDSRNAPEVRSPGLSSEKAA